MKTAMQELKDVIGEMIKNGGTEEDLFAVIAHIDNWAFEKEKEQICNAYTDGLEGPYLGAEQYYNQTYK